MGKRNEELIKKAKTFLERDNRVVTRLVKVDNYNDYPPYFQYTCAYRTGSADEEMNINGLSFDEEEAKAKAVMETVERWAFHNASATAKTYNLCLPERNTTLFRGEKAGLFPDDSSGCASGVSQEDALERALLELVEREAFAIYYYNRLTPAVIDPGDFPEHARLFDTLERYGFRINLFSLSTDLNIPTCMCLLEDLSGIKPHFTLGLKAGRIWSAMVEGAVLESLQSLVSFRDMAAGHAPTESPILRRIRFWLDKKPRQNLGFFFGGGKARIVDSSSPVLESLEKAGIKEVFYRRLFKGQGVTVMQVAVPELVKLPLDGRTILDAANSRLHSLPPQTDRNKIRRAAGEFNGIPHPFP